jgi:hypothetical protein
MGLAVVVSKRVVIQQRGFVLGCGIAGLNTIIAVAADGVARDVGNREEVIAGVCGTIGAEVDAVYDAERVVLADGVAYNAGRRAIVKDADAGTPAESAPIGCPADDIALNQVVPGDGRGVRCCVAVRGLVDDAVLIVGGYGVGQDLVVLPPESRTPI